MNHLDCVNAEMSATNSGSVIKSTFCIGLLAFSPAAAALRGPEGTQVPSSEFLSKSVSISSSAQQTATIEITGIQVFNALSNLHDKLVENQVDLDPEIRKVLYENLWDLYE